MPIHRKSLIRRIIKASAVFLTLVSWNLIAALPVSLAAEKMPDEMKINMDSTSDTISMSFDGALLKDILLLFSQQSGLNFVASQETENKKVTVYFENVSPQDALDSIVTANGLVYTKKPGSDIYIVYPASDKTDTAELVTRVIHLKYMRLSTSPLDVGGGVTISDLKQSSSPTSSGSSSSSSSSSSAGSSSSSDNSKTSTEKGADKLVAQLLTSQGKLTQDSQTNSLVITDTADNIDAIVKILEEIDVPPSQVILEVHVMEVVKSLTSNLGVDWGGENGALGSLTAGTRTTHFPFQENFVRHIGPEPGAIVQALGGTTAVPTSAMTLGTINASNLTATLHYIESDARTKILARPRVLTQNNEAASIKVVTNQAIGQTNTTTTTAGSNTTSTGVADRAEVGVAMRMTPQINKDDSVLLFLEPAVTTVSDSTLFPGVFRDATTRLVRTMARIKDNQTLVIGGLIDANNSSTKKKVPILGDLPGIGRVFRYDTVSNVDRELLIFVTPHIVHGATSLGDNSATARGEDFSMRKVLDAFMDKEMDTYTKDFQGFEKTKESFFTRNQQFIRETEKRMSNPTVDKQMTQALDALNPQLIDAQMNQALDTLSTKRHQA